MWSLIPFWLHLISGFVHGTFSRSSTGTGKSFTWTAGIQCISLLLPCCISCGVAADISILTRPWCRAIVHFCVVYAVNNDRWWTRLASFPTLSVFLFLFLRFFFIFNNDALSCTIHMGPTALGGRTGLDGRKRKRTRDTTAFSPLLKFI